MTREMKPRYSGPNRVGVCICGCSWEGHHLGAVLNSDYAKATQESWVPQECDDCDSCYSYKDRGENDY